MREHLLASSPPLTAGAPQPSTTAPTSPAPSLPINHNNSSNNIPEDISLQFDFELSDRHPPESPPRSQQCHASRRRRSSSSSSTPRSKIINPQPRAKLTSKSHSPSNGGFTNWEAFYSHYKAQRAAKRLSIAEELQLDAAVAALFVPPVSYGGSERASAIDTHGRFYVGSACSAQDPLWLQENQITHVLNVADEVGLNESVLQGSGIVYRWLSIPDHCEYDIRSQFDTAFEFLFMAFQQGGRVLLHCAAGVSRSATIAIAFMMCSEKLQLKEALLLVRERRPFVYPNRGFFVALYDYEEELFACNSLPRSALDMHEEA